MCIECRRRTALLLIAYLTTDIEPTLNQSLPRGPEDADELRERTGLALLLTALTPAAISAGPDGTERMVIKVEAEQVERFRERFKPSEARRIGMLADEMAQQLTAAASFVADVLLPTGAEEPEQSATATATAPAPALPRVLSFGKRPAPPVS